MRVPNEPFPEEWSDRVESFLAAEHRLVRVLRKRKPKILDARAQIEGVKKLEEQLQVTLQFGSGATVKISEAIAAVVGLEWLQRIEITKKGVRLGKREAADKGDPAAASVDTEVLDLTENLRPAPPQRRNR